MEKENRSCNIRWPLHAALAALLITASAPVPMGAQQPGSRPPFDVVEADIAGIHAAMLARTLTCRSLVEQYLRRIAAYDRNGPAINSIIVVNPRVLADADILDRRFTIEGLTGPLHCIPLIVKDNFETAGLATTAGSLSLEGLIPERDAFMVKRLRDAGALVLAKSNLAEFAFTPYETVSSILPGYTRNPYDLSRVTAGSSGGTAAAVAASMGTAGLGTDTGNSIRGPSSHLALVGVRSTMGLTSRAGIAPLNLGADIAGPIARTVADAAAVFQAIVGEDPDDTVTARSRGRPIPTYSDALRADGLRGARIGVFTQAYLSPTTDPEVVRVFDAAIADLRKAGAIVIDSAIIGDLDSLRRTARGCNSFKHDIEEWLARHGERAPVRTVEEILGSRRYHPLYQARLEAAQAESLPPATRPSCALRDSFRVALRASVLEVMARHRLDALVYPTWSNVPRLTGDLNTPHGDNNQLFSPSTGFPAITVPMGFTRGGTLPAGLQFFGRPWSEETLFRLSFAYEQATNHRRPPSTTPPLRDGG
ncbi:MAG TPA: amidase family protein [Gemmatimonadaceae bacterium]|nr:amidase family protein [Gemmatimonadaceae bacterium]